MKKFIALSIISLTFLNLLSCSTELDAEDIYITEILSTESTEQISIIYEDEYGFITGNEQNNTVFWHNVICEDSDFVYVGSYRYIGDTTDINQNIVKINKNDNSITELNYRGFNLNVYDGYLYFLDDENLLYRLNLYDSDAIPELITYNFIYTYMIINDKIYPSGWASPIFRMNLDGSEKEEYSDMDKEDIYFICGNDDKYIYIIFSDEFETEIIDGIETNIYYLSRVNYNGKNKEKLFKIYTDNQIALQHHNNFMIISNGYAYYSITWNENHEILKNKLTLDSEKEILFKQDYEYERFSLTAVTNDGIYVKTFDVRDNKSFEDYNPDIKLSLNGKIQNQTDFPKDNLLFFVSRSDRKLYYIEDNSIFLADN